uniref:ApaG domain-containing protein n=1 Tax=Rhodosorus marinus TaxID=101924 RepID=A0A7S0BN83_9RHOD
MVGRRKLLRRRSLDDEDGDKWKVSQEAYGGNDNGIVEDGERREKLWAEIEALETYLKRVVSAERYGEASEIKEEIDTLKRRDPYESLKIDLDVAVSEERYMDAAEIRDKLKAISPPPRTKEEPGKSTKDQWPPATASNKSELVSNGIRVRMESFYIAEQSKPEDKLYIFGYKVVVTNESANTVQLISRHLKVRFVGGDGVVWDIQGPGVVGRQPVLEPKENFTYTSLCPFKNPPQDPIAGKPMGSMSGTYKFVFGSTGAESFDSTIMEYFFIFPSGEGNSADSR